TDAAVDAQRQNLRENRPAVQAAAASIADYYHQRGLSGQALNQETSTVLGTSVVLESAARSIQQGLRFLSLTIGGTGLLVTFLLMPAPGSPVQKIPDRLVLGGVPL